jgi:hypothetical protein
MATDNTSQGAPREAKVAAIVSGSMFAALILAVIVYAIVGGYAARGALPGATVPESGRSRRDRQRGGERASP